MPYSISGQDSMPQHASNATPHYRRNMLVSILPGSNQEHYQRSLEVPVDLHNYYVLRLSFSPDQCVGAIDIHVGPIYIDLFGDNWAVI